MKNTIYFLIYLTASLIMSLSALFFINYLNINSINSSINYINIMNTNYISVRGYAPPLYFIDNYIEKIEKLKEIFEEKRIIEKPTTARLRYKASLISYLGEEEIIINGIIPKNDKEFFNISEKIEKLNNENYIIISSSTAEALNIDIDDNIILKLITKDGYYKAEEYIILDIAENLNYNYALIDIDKLNNLINLNDYASEIYIKDKNIEPYKDMVKEIFGNDFDIYSLSYFLSDFEDFEEYNKLNKLKIYIIYLFTLFSIFMFINSYFNNHFDKNFNNNKEIKNKILFSIIGFISAYIIYSIINYIIIRRFDFNIIYIIMALVNLITVILSNIIFNILNKILNNKSKNLIKILTIFLFIIIYSSTLIIIYFSALSLNNTINDKEKNTALKILKIVKKNNAEKNISDNTFLSEGKITNIDNIINEIKTLDNESEIKNILSFPAGVVTRTGSAQSRVYNILEDFENKNDISNYIIEGKIYEDYKNQIIIGKELADYLKLKVGDAVSLMAKGSRGWLETAYFTISGIYELKNKNYNIYAGINTISNFIYTNGGNKSPYNESLLIFSKKPIYSHLIKSDIFKDTNIINFDNSHKLNTAILIFIIIFSFSIALLSSSILSIFFKNMENINGKKFLIKNYTLSLILSMILFLIAVLFHTIILNFILFTISIIILVFLLSIIITNFNKISAE